MVSIPKQNNFGADKLVLGTANFDMFYGLEREKLDKTTVTNLLNLAAENNIEHLDTANGYGNSEELIGKLIPLGLQFKITTKIDPSNCKTVDDVLNVIKESLDKTHQKRLWSVLIHRPEVLFGNNSTIVKIALLEALKNDLTENIGVSAYTLAEVCEAKQSLPELKIFQIPENILDRRIASSQEIHKLSRSGNLFFVRSIFLQGLLTSDPDKLPLNLRDAREVLIELGKISVKLNLDIISLCIAYAKSLSWANGILVGVNSTVQLREIVSAFNKSYDIDFSEFPRLDPNLVDPRSWS
jgi:aryl-alcohol dehydrogenase-like predicted oxidoreductase